MTKLHLPKLPKFLNKTVVYVSVGVIVLLALTAFGAVEKVRDDRSVAAHNAVVARDAEAKQKALNNELTSLQAENKDLKGQAQVGFLACTELKRLDAIRAITASVTVPAYCPK
jgi:cell division protein FtsL